MSSNFKKNLFFGSLWGIFEATLGYLLHLIPIPISGMIMFPIGVFFMKRAEKATGKSNSIFIVSLIAAVIKSVNFLMPNPNVFKVINPILMIITQGLLVYVLLSERSQFSVYKAFALSVGWRIILLAIMFVEIGDISKIYYFRAGLFRIINFLVINTSVNTVIITFIKRYGLKNPIKFNPNVGVVSFVLAIAIQFML